MRRRKKVAMPPGQQVYLKRSELLLFTTDFDSIVIAHPDKDHAPWLQLPHHGSGSALTGLKSSVIHLHGSGLSQVEPPRYGEYLLFCLLPRKNRVYLIGCLEDEFRRVILPTY